MTRAWPVTVLFALVFTGAWIVGRYSDDGGTDFRRSNVLIVRVAPNVVLQPTPKITAAELQRALRERRPPVVVTVKKP